MEVIKIRDRNQLLELWGDLVEIKSLIMSIIISIILTMGAYFMAEANNRLEQLIFGLGGAIVAFIISTFLVKPKRIIIVEEESMDE